MGNTAIIDNRFALRGEKKDGKSEIWRLEPTGQPYAFFASLILAGYENWTLSSAGVNPAEEGEHFCAWDVASNRTIELINSSTFEQVQACLTGRPHPEEDLIRILAATGC
jgi:hypothetical protein